MKRLMFLLALIPALLLLASCKGEDAPEAPDIPELTEGESITLTLSIPRALRDTTVTIDTGDGSAFAHTFGSGQDFTIEGFAPDASGRFVLPAAKDATSLAFTVQTLDDDVFETEELAVLRILGEAADFSAELSAACTFRILDNDTTLFVNVQQDFGAKGDGVADDTQALQAAIDKVAEAGGGVVFLPKGEYIVSSVEVRTGMTILGEEGTVVKRPPMQGKWCRTFYMHYVGDTDSTPLVIRDMTIDGNSQNQGPYKRYELEQAHLVFFCGIVEGHNDDAPKGRVRGAAENLKLSNCVGDGVSIYSNCDVGVYNITAVDVFRGGLVITGGNTRVRASHIVTQAGEMDDAGGLDIEVDGPGYGGTLFVDVEIHQFHAESGDFDVLMPDGGIARFYDCTVGYPAMDIGGDQVGELSFHRCRFAVGLNHRPGVSPTAMQFYVPNEVTFNDCEFVATVSFAPVNPPSSLGKLVVSPVSKIQWLGVAAKNPESRMVFNRCRFSVDDSVTAYPDHFQAVAFVIEKGSGSSCQLILNDCEISKDYDMGFIVKSPVYLELNRLANNAKEGNSIHEGSTVVVNP